jgi:hypothetical protein
MWKCLSEHPDIYLPKTDAIHYFTTKFHKGEEWYLGHFKEWKGESIIGDTTPQYAKYGPAQERMYACNPDARVVLMMRHPIERAWSHYSHEWRKGVTSQPFSFGLENNLDTFRAWIETGFYSYHLEGIYQFYDAGRVHVVLYDDIKSDPLKVLQNVLRFLQVDSNTIPSNITARVNAKPRPENSDVANTKTTKLNFLKSIFGSHSKGKTAVCSESQNAPPKILESFLVELADIYRPHIERLESQIGRDLNSWKIIPSLV